MNFKENETPTKLRGGYYTNPEIALFLTRWVFEIQPKTILEPSCGDGVFIDSVAHANSRCLESFVGFEIESSESQKARKRARTLKDFKVEIHTREFLKWSLSHLLEQLSFDAVLGNPPFIRYQYLDSQLQERAKKIFEFFRLPFTKHTNAWVPFVMLSIAHLRPGGRLGMVVPSEILHVLHAQSLRTFLVDQCSKVLIFDPVELWFEEVLQGAVLLLAEKKAKPNSKFFGVAIVPTKNRAFLQENPSSYFDTAEFSDGEILTGKWMRALLTKHERSILEDVSQRKNVFRFDQVANVDVGIVTGANKFFLVPDRVVTEYGLERWAHPMFGRSEHVRGIIYGNKTHEENRRLGLPTNFLWFDEEDWTNLPASVRAYILTGEKADIHRRYKCRIRNPWYKVPSVYATAVGMLKRCHEFPRLILNKANAYTTDTCYRIRSLRVASSRLVFSFVNSLTALSAELEGRHYGGGVLELVPSEIERLLLPLPTVKPVSLKRLDDQFRKSLPPEELLSSQDKVLLKGIGLKEKDRADLLSAWIRLRERRQRKQGKQSISSYEISIKNGSVAPLGGA